MNSTQTRTYKGHTITIVRHIRKGFRTNYVIFIDGEFTAQTTVNYSFDSALSAARKQIDSKAATQTTTNNSLTLQKVG